MRDRELEAAFTARSLPDALSDLVARAKDRGGADCDNIAVAAARHARARGWRFARLRHWLWRGADETVDCPEVEGSNVVELNRWPEHQTQRFDQAAQRR